MKRIKNDFALISILVIALVFSACGTKPAAENKPKVSPTGTAVQPTDIQGPTGAAGQVSPAAEAPRATISNEIIKNMADLVFADSKPSGLLAYIGGHIASSSLYEADGMLLILESIQKAWLDYYINSVDLGANADPQKSKALLDEMTGNGFRLVEMNRSKVPVIDYSLYRQWEGKLSDWFRDYTVIIQAETDSPAVTNGKLAITKEELEKRLLSVSGYIQKYPTSIRVNQVISLYDSYLYCYLYGYDRDPVINLASGKISMEYYNRYLELVKNNPDTMVSSIISGYASLIEKSSFVLTEELGIYLEEVFSSLEDQRIVVRNDIGRQVLMERMGRLLPDKTGFAWKCLGSGGYEHAAALTGIHTEDGNPVYTVTGLVASSGVENPEVPLDIELEYRIENGTLFQIKAAPSMMDSEFNELEIIRYPFVVGHRWYQYPEDEGINNTSIQTEIISVTQDNGEYVYEVEYRDTSTDQYEKRLLQSGKGTIAFTKLYSDGESEPFEIGYFIDEANTGYPPEVTP